MSEPVIIHIVGGGTVELSMHCLCSTPDEKCRGMGIHRGTWWCRILAEDYPGLWFHAPHSSQVKTLVALRDGYLDAETRAACFEAAWRKEFPTPASHPDLPGLRRALAIVEDAIGQAGELLDVRDQLRAIIGECEGPLLTITEGFAALAEAADGRFDGVDAPEYVAELRR